MLPSLHSENVCGAMSYVHGQVLGPPCNGSYVSHKLSSERIHSPIKPFILLSRHPVYNFLPSFTNTLHTCLYCVGCFAGSLFFLGLPYQRGEIKPLGITSRSVEGRDGLLFPQSVPSFPLFSVGGSSESCHSQWLALCCAFHLH